MCFDHHARPHIAPVAGGATDARDLTLTSTDGTEVMAHAARIRDFVARHTPDVPAP